MTPQTFAALLLLQNVVVGAVVAWAMGLPMWQGLTFGALFGLGQSTLIIIGNQRSWLRADLFTKKNKRPTERPITPGLLTYCLGFCILVGISFGLIEGLPLVLWLVWLPFLLVLGVLFAWILAQIY